MAIAATIAVNIIAKTEAFSKAMQDMSTKLKSTGDEIESAGRALTTAFTVPLGIATAGIYSAVQAASDLGETQSAVGVVYGETADQIFAFSETAATALGMSQQEALEAARVFGMYAQAAELSGQQTVDFSTQMINLAADLASFNNANPEDTIYAIGAAFRGEMEPIRNYINGIDDAAMRQKALELGLISTTKNALTPQQKILSANALLLELSSVQAGDFARTSGGLANQQRILTAELANAAAKLGEAFLPVALQLVTLVRDEVIPRITTFATKLAEVPTPVIAIGTALGGMLAILGPVLVVVGSGIKAFGDIAGAAGKFANMISKNVIPAVMRLNAALLANPFALVGVALAALAAAFVYVYQRSETFRELVSGLVDPLISFAQTIRDKVGATVEWLGQKFDSVFGAMYDKVAGFVGGAVNFLGGLLPERVRTSMAAFSETLTTGVRGAVDTAQQIISELRAPSLDLGVTGSNAAARDALYDPIIQASRDVASGFEIDFAKVSAASDKVTTELDKTAIGHIPMQEAMRRQIELTQAEAAVIIATTKSREEMWDRINENRAMMVEQTLAGEVLTTAMGALKDMNDIAKDKLSGLGSEALTLGSRFTPLGLLMEVLGEAFETLKPMVESLMEPFKIIGLVLGKALGSVLKALFPVIKMVAIAFTYIGQIFFKIAEFSAKSFGYLIKAIGKAIDAIPFVSAKKVIRAGEALINMGEGFGQAYKDLGAAREEIRGLELPEEKEKEAEAIAKKGADASVETAENTKKIAESMEKIADRPPIVINVTGTNGGTAGGLGEEIAAQLDQYYGRAILREERNLGRIGAF